MAHVSSGCCPPPTLLPRKRSCPVPTTTTVLCSHGNGPECLDDGPCSGRVDGYPTILRHKLKKLDQPGTFMDVDTHECFRVTPDQTLERLYPKLPSKPLRVKGAIYEVTTGVHAKWDGKRLRNPCRDCPVDAKKQASHPDEDGNPARLCAVCADKVGTKIVLNPCRDCPVDAKKQANYPDEDGNPTRLCAVCAFEKGLRPQATSGASMVACRCWHRLEKVSKAKLTHHVCCIDPTKWAGEEKKGLIPGRAFKPDAYIEPNLPIHLECETSGPKGAVYLFHGNEWHGYPEEHPKYDEVNYCGDSYKERYHKTLAQEEMYKMEGYRVFVVWEHAYGASEKAKCPVHIQGVVREV